MNLKETHHNKTTLIKCFNKPKGIISQPESKRGGEETIPSRDIGERGDRKRSVIDLSKKESKGTSTQWPHDGIHNTPFLSRNTK